MKALEYEFSCVLPSPGADQSLQDLPLQRSGILRTGSGGGARAVSCVSWQTQRTLVSAYFRGKIAGKRLIYTSIRQRGQISWDFGHNFPSCKQLQGAEVAVASKLMKSREVPLSKLWPAKEDVEQKQNEKKQKFAEDLERNRWKHQKRYSTDKRNWTVTPGRTHHATVLVYSANSLRPSLYYAAEPPECPQVRCPYGRRENRWANSWPGQG